MIHGTRVYFFDVDNTLVFPERDVLHLLSTAADKDKLGAPIYFGDIRFYPHLAHISLIKELKARGHSVIVWSAGNSYWAEQVIRALKLENSVDLVMSKPDGICDDKSVVEWLPEVDRFYIPIGEFKGGK